MNVKLSSQETARLYAIERRLKLLLGDLSDERLAHAVGANWQSDKVRGCIEDLRQLANGRSAEEVTWNPAAIA